VNVRRGLAAAGVSLFGVLSGCVTAPFHDAKVDPRSPIAAEVAKTVNPDAPYPTFATFPAKPKDLRPARQYGRAAAAVESEAAKIIKATSEESWTLTDAEGFAAQARAEAGPAAPAAIPGDAEAFAKQQKARANPPSPVKRD
jgi:hypothetical protein